MWIRSQDKEVLRNANDIEIIKFDGEKYTTILGDGCHLGYYSTKAKALSVLDEIQRFIYHIDNLYATFQMPSDDEVEENG